MIMEILFILTTSMLISWLWYSTTVLQDVTNGEKWVKGTWDLSVLFLTTSCESIIITTKNFNFFNLKKKL